MRRTVTAGERQPGRCQTSTKCHFLLTLGWSFSTGLLPSSSLIDCFLFPSRFSSVRRTPLHCAASCNNVSICKFLVESGAAVFASTYSDMQTAADKCEEMEEGYAQCSQFLYGTTKNPELT